METLFIHEAKQAWLFRRLIPKTIPGNLVSALSNCLFAHANGSGKLAFFFFCLGASSAYLDDDIGFVHARPKSICFREDFS